jgi:hypothetical protein
LWLPLVSGELFPRRFLVTLRKMVDAEKKENTDEAVAAAEAGEVLAPYSIYGNREKWMIVGMVALAGFYR